MPSVCNLFYWLANQRNQSYMLALADLSYVQLLQGNPEAALATLQETWPIAQATGGPELLARLSWAQADIHASLGDTAAAYELYWQAITHLEEIRGRLQRESDRASFITVERARVFGKLVLFLHQVAGRSAEAIMVAERARSRLFLDQLASGRYDAVDEVVRGETVTYEQIRRCLRQK
jgi:hypothetical protein